MPYIIRAEIDATDDMPGLFARDWFKCGINDKSDRYPSADAALKAARAAYKGPNADGIECRVWVERVDLPRFRGEVRSWDQRIWFDGILSSSFE